MVERCHKQGFPVAVYTVNEPDELLLLMEMGVDAVFTDHPDLMIEVLAKGSSALVANAD